MKAKEFIVIGAYVCESCPLAHSVEVRVRGKTAQGALDRVHAFMKSQGWNIGDMVCFEHAGEMWTLDQFRNAYPEQPMAV